MQFLSFKWILYVVYPQKNFDTFRRSELTFFARLFFNLTVFNDLSGLGDVKDELQMFIDSQKRKIDNERRELNKAKAVYSPRDDKLVSIILTNVLHCVI